MSILKACYFSFFHADMDLIIQNILLTLAMEVRFKICQHIFESKELKIKKIKKTLKSVLPSINLFAKLKRQK